MRLFIAVAIIILSNNIGFSQDGFRIDEHKNKVVIPFKLVNNLIFIPIKVNGQELTFLVDTGVEETVLFSLDDNEEINFFNVKKIKLKGMGNSDAIDALKSSKNKLEINGLYDDNHEIYIILNQDFNFSSQVGIPVNGIIGYNFFKNHLIEINYSKKKIFIYNKRSKIEKRINKRFFVENITLERNKPYLITEINFESKSVNSKLLLDTGNSDALWVFQNKLNALQLPKLLIDDYLGRGFSGNVYGKRGRIPFFKFGNNKFDNPIATFPDSISTRDVVMVKDRIGSLGGEVFRRFTIIFDYPKGKLYTRSNDYLNEPFNFNMSGIEIQHDGLEWVNESYLENPTLGENVFDSNGKKIFNNFQFKFELKPIFKISNVREGSTAAIAGLIIGDKILKINHVEAHNYTLERINQILKSEEDKTIDMVIERNGKTIKVKFQLKTIL